MTDDDIKRDDATADDDASDNALSESTPTPEVPAPPDRRLYVLDGENWSATTRHGAERQYCYVQNPGEDYFHLILPGEIFLRSGDETVCLNCALRRGLITTDRLFWQHRGRSAPPQI